MADKKVIVIAAGNCQVETAGAACAGLVKKSAVFKNYTAGDVLADVMKINGAVKTEATGLEESFEKDVALAVMDLTGADAEKLEAEVAKAIDVADRRTMIVVATDKVLYFYGYGVAKGSLVERAAVAKDIVPTIAYVAGLYVPEDCTGAVLYQALKDPNAPLKDNAKLQDALKRMEAALQRDNREPWDKHDCA